MSSAETALAAELKASRERAEQLAALLDAERKVSGPSLGDSWAVTSHPQPGLEARADADVRSLQRATEAEKLLVERERALVESNRPKVSPSSRTTHLRETLSPRASLPYATGKEAHPCGPAQVDPEEARMHRQVLARNVTAIKQHSQVCLLISTGDTNEGGGSPEGRSERQRSAYFRWV